MPAASLLVVEDQAEIRGFLRSSLSSEGYKVVESPTAGRAVVDARTHRPDLAIVDLGLPDHDGLHVIRSIREWSPMPILVLSARTHERSKIEALDAGADDYVTKPFGMGELFARVRVALRHAARSASGATKVRLGSVELDLAGKTATLNGEPSRLTAIEARLLACLARHSGMVVTHKTLLTEVWGPSHVADTHYLRVYMKQLRHKLEPDPMRPRYLRTETGIGYRLTPDD